MNMAKIKSLSKKDAEAVMSLLASLLVLGIIDLDFYIEVMLNIEEKTPRYRTDRWDSTIQLHRLLVDLDRR